MVRIIVNYFFYEYICKWHSKLHIQFFLSLFISKFGLWIKATTIKREFTNDIRVCETFFFLQTFILYLYYCFLLGVQSSCVLIVFILKFVNFVSLFHFNVPAGNNLIQPNQTVWATCWISNSYSFSQCYTDLYCYLANTNNETQSIMPTQTTSNQWWGEKKHRTSVILYHEIH